jgi:hypothetical protein
MKQTWARHFSLPHPLFRKEKTETGIWWEKSVYHYWWLFLREHSGYEKTCESGGSGKYARLYQDFGDVHAGAFKSWWNGGRGARLFAEPAVPINIEPLTAADLAELPNNFHEHLVLLAIDKSLPLKTILRGVRSSLKKAGAVRERGKKTQYQSRALYPVATLVPDGTLKKTLEIYKYHKLNPKIKLWELGDKFRVSGPSMKPAELEAARKRYKSGDGSDYRVLKNRLTVGARRYIENAESIIEWVGKGKFPVFTTTEP